MHQCIRPLIGACCAPGIIADYDVQSAVERELVLRLASVLWRLRRATTMETGLLEIQAGYRPASSVGAYSVDADVSPPCPGSAKATQVRTNLGSKFLHSATDLATCFLRLANLPSFPLDRLSRYEAILWRQASQIVFALDVLDRRKPQERRQRWV